MKLSVDDVRHVAKLAALALSAEEEESFRGQLEDVLSAVAQLEQADTAGVAPTAAVHGAPGTLRADAVQGELGLDKAFANAPSRAGSHFSVPKVIE